MTPHLRGHVRAYVDRALPPAILHVYDRHLVCCGMCRAAADQERRIVASLRSDRGLPGGLRSSLIGLATAAPGEPAPIPQTARIQLPSMGLRMQSMPSRGPVPTVPPTAPALHRSPMRAAVVASIAAGASVAAAWGLAVSPSPGGSRVPAARVPAGVANVGGAGLGTAGTGLTSVGSGLNSGSLPSPGASATAVDRREAEIRRRSESLPATSYWVVDTADPRSSTRSAIMGPVRVSLVNSAQSGP